MRKILQMIKKVFAYLQALFVLIKASLYRLVGNDTYKVSFIRIKKKWYCEVPGFPRALFEHTLMVGGATKMLDELAGQSLRIIVTVKLTDKENGKFSLKHTSSTLTGGAFYRDESGTINEEIWLCPVTLFLLGGYPRNIQILEVKSWMPSVEQLRRILDNAIEYSFPDCKKHLEETIIKEFNTTKSYHRRVAIATDFAETVGYEYQCFQ